MTSFRNFLIAAYLLPFLFICSCSQRGNQKTSPKTPSEVTADENTVSKHYDPNAQAIDFFGVKLRGELTDVIERIYQLPFISCIEQRDSVSCSDNGVMHFVHTVELCGVPCGMNVRYKMISEKDIAIHELTFITSKTDNWIIQKFVSELTGYYGEADFPDTHENNYQWYRHDGLCVCARHLHSRDGGWTVYMYMKP